jgi:hypothetical protein
MGMEKVVFVALFSLFAKINDENIKKINIFLMCTPLKIYSIILNIKNTKKFNYKSKCSSNTILFIYDILHIIKI